MEIKKLLLDAVPLPFVRLFAGPYIAGESVAAAVAKADELFQTLGLLSTIDMLGESIENEEDALACKDRYLGIVGEIRNREYCTISLKPTSMGLEQGQDLCLANIEAVVREAREAGRGITIDMEDRPTVDATLEIYRTLRSRYDNVGTVLQTKLFRTEADIEALKDVGGRVRLCIGAYPEPPEVAHTEKPAMKEALFRYALRLLELDFTVELATHDGAIIDRILAEARARGLPVDRLEIQWLLGVPVEQLRQRYAAQNLPMRVYVPYCDEWKYAASYLKRRLLLNPHLLLYVLGNLAKKSN